MSDHPILVKVWKILRQKKNVLIFIDTEDIEESADLIIEWFNSIIENRISIEDAKMKNGAFLCIRKVLERMPPINDKTKGEYEILILNSNQIEEIKEKLNVG